jgi:DNA-directed RNA polymerase specialized sigma24 family protein
MNTLKDYIVEYRNGNEDVLKDLIGKETVIEKNNKGEDDKIYYLKLNDKALNYIYKVDILSKFNWIDRKDIDAYVNEALMIIFSKADTERSPSEIIAWAKQRLIGTVKDCIRKNEREYYDHTKPESQYQYNAAEGTTELVSLYDQYVHGEYIKLEEINLYDKFIEYIGGMEKLLSGHQFEIYTRIKVPGSTQESIAKDLGITQPAVHKTIRAIQKRFKEEYLNFRTYRALKSSLNTYEKINQFLHNFKVIQQFDTSKQFDFFGYTVKFLRDNYTDSQKVSYKELHKNKQTSHITVIDALVDEIEPKNIKWFGYILKHVVYDHIDDFAMYKKDKSKFVEIVLNSFGNYRKEVKGATDHMNHRITEDISENEYNLFVDIVS